MDPVGMRRAPWLGNARVRIPLDSTRVNDWIATRPGAAVVDSETAHFEEQQELGLGARAVPLPHRPKGNTALPQATPQAGVPPWP